MSVEHIVYNKGCENAK